MYASWGRPLCLVGCRGGEVFAEGTGEQEAVDHRDTGETDQERTECEQELTRFWNIVVVI